MKKRALPHTILYTEFRDRPFLAIYTLLYSPLLYSNQEGEKYKRDYICSWRHCCRQYGGPFIGLSVREKKSLSRVQARLKSLAAVQKPGSLSISRSPSAAAFLALPSLGFSIFFFSFQARGPRIRLVVCACVCASGGWTTFYTTRIVPTRYIIFPFDKKRD